MRVFQKSHFNPSVLWYYVILCNIIVFGEEPQQNTRTKVIIIGAGPSGIAAASKLAQNNISEFLVLEARNRIGGRIHTFPTDGQIIELGAQYIHGEQGNAVYELVKNLGIYDHYTNDVETLAMVSPEEIKFRDSYEKYIYDTKNAIIKSGINETENNNYEDFFIPRFQSHAKNLNLSNEETEIIIDIIKKMEGISNAGQMNEIGFRGLYQYEEIQGDQGMTWKTGIGYKIVLDILMGKYPNEANNLGIEEKILLNKEVTRVEWNDESVQVHCADASTYVADSVIVTLPLGVLKSHSDSFFHPPLPDYKMKAIKALGFGTVDKIFLKFDDKWWNFTESLNFGMTHTAINQYKSTSKVGSWPTELTGFYTVKNMPKMLVTWLSGKGAIQMENMTDNEVIDGCNSMIELIYGKNSKTIKPATGIIRTRWNSEPFTRGSYSFLSVESDVNNITNQHLAEPLLNSRGKPIVMFAGEATHEKFFSTVHGAIETGRREANRVLNMS